MPPCWYERPARAHTEDQFLLSDNYSIFSRTRNTLRPRAERSRHLERTKYLLIIKTP